MNLIRLSHFEREVILTDGACLNQNSYVEYALMNEPSLSNRDDHGRISKRVEDCGWRICHDSSSVSKVPRSSEEDDSGGLSDGPSEVSVLSATVGAVGSCFRRSCGTFSTENVLVTGSTTSCPSLLVGYS